MFNILQRLHNPKYSWYERAEAQVKYSIYSIMHELLQCQIAFPLFFNLLLLIEGGQFLWYAIHPDYEFLWNTDFSKYPRDIIKFFQVDSLLREGDQNTYYAFLYIGFSIQLVMFISVLLVLFMLEKAKKKSSSLVFYTLRLLSFYALLLSTIGPIPLSHIFTVAIICRDNDPLRGSVQCYTGVHLVNMSVGIFGIITMVLFSFLTQLLYTDLNPSSNIPFACPQSNLAILKLFLKIGLPIYLTVDYDLEYAREFVGVYCLVWLLVLVMRYSSQGYYNKSVTICATLMESLVFWAALVAIIHALLDNESMDDTGLYYFLFAAPFATYTYYKIFMRQKWGLLRSNIRNFKRAIQFEKYINVVTSLIEHIEIPKSRVQVEGLLRYHVRFCKNEASGCPCGKMSTMLGKENEDPAETKASWHQFVRRIILDGMAMFPKNSSLHLQHAYFQQEKLHNKYKALFELAITEETRPNIQEEFSIFRYRNIIEKEMIEDDIRNSDSRGIDVNMIVHFQGKLVALQGEIGKAVNMQLDFWRELDQTNPNVQKLLSLGSRITVQGDIVKNSYSKLCELNPNHIRMLKLYGNFLLDILHDTFEAERILENVEYAERSLQVNKDTVDNERLKYSENSKTCIITCSANLHSMGKVLSANNETMDVLQYVHTDLIGEKINNVMPSIMADIHDDLMRRYFETNTARVMGRERIVFPMTRTGYIVPCHLMIKIFPNLDEGIRVVGFMRKVDSKSAEDGGHHKAYYVVYGGDDNTIYGVTENCYESFGIPASLTNGDHKDFTAQSIFPDLLDQNIDELKNTSTGLVLSIDTSALQQNFLIGRQDSEESEEDDETKQMRYRSSKVRATLISDDVLLDTYKVKVLRFVEVSENETKIVKTDIVQDELKKKKRRTPGESNSQETDPDVSMSDGSNFSLGSSLGEDNRQLKDMKAKITEKSVPSSISALQTVSMVLTLGLIIFAGVLLDKRITMQDDLKAGLMSTRSGYERYSLLPDINRGLRLLDLLANNMIIEDISLSQYEVALRDEIATLIVNLTATQFALTQTASYISQTMGTSTSVDIPVKNMLLDGSIATSIKDISSVVFQYTSAAQKLNTMDLPTFLEPLSPASATIPFYYIQRNGLNSLRTGIETRAQVIYQNYQDRTDYYSQFYLILMIVAIVFLALCEAIIVPKIFSVNKTNMKVLALFGYIPLEEVDKLAEKCEKYMELYLDELTAKREDSYYYNDDEELEKSLHQPDNSHKNLRKRASNLGESHEDSAQQNYSMQMKEFSYKDELPQSKLKTPPASQLVAPDPESQVMMTNKSIDEDKSLGLGSPLNQRTELAKPTEENDRKDAKSKGKDKGQDKKEEEEDEEQLAFLEERSNKLKNSKDNSKGLVILQLMVVGLIFTAYFIADFFHEEGFLANFRQGLSHLKVISQRLPNLQYILLFATEEIAEDNLSIVYPEIDPSIVATDNYRTQFSDKADQNRAAVQETFKLSFPSDFDNYLSTLLSYNQGDVCKLFYVNDPVNRQACETGGVKLGLYQSEVSFIQNVKAAMSQFYATSGRTKQTQIDSLNGVYFDTAKYILQTIDPIMDSLITSFLEAFSSYFDSMFLLQSLKFLVFFLCLVLLFLFVWLPYLGRLKMQIFRTKGLLNMIPMDMLKKSKSLRETFTSNEIWRAVQ